MTCVFHSNKWVSCVPAALLLHLRAPLGMHTSTLHFGPFWSISVYFGLFWSCFMSEFGLFWAPFGLWWGIASWISRSLQLRPRPRRRKSRSWWAICSIYTYQYWWICINNEPLNPFLLYFYSISTLFLLFFYSISATRFPLCCHAPLFWLHCRSILPYFCSISLQFHPNFTPNFPINFDQLFLPLGHLSKDVSHITGNTCESQKWIYKWIYEWIYNWTYLVINQSKSIINQSI